MFYVLLFVKLISIILIKVTSNFLYIGISCFSNSFNWLTKSILLRSNLNYFNKICGVNFKDNRRNSVRKLGVVVITRHCIQRISSRDESFSDTISRTMKNSALFERVLGEISVDTVVSWVANLIQKENLGVSAESTNLILVHRKQNNDLYNFYKWFDIVPNHNQSKIQLANNHFKIGEVDAYNYILSSTRSNLSRNYDCEDPRVYCSFGRLYSHFISYSLRGLSSTENTSSLRNKLLSKFQYISSEVSEPLDLINVQQSTGLLYEHVLNDSISVIVPMGYGHPDDCIDSEDVELIIIIDSSPVRTKNPSNSSDNPSVTEYLHNIQPRCMVNIQLNHYDPLETSVLKPNRGELIRYAIDQYAKGSMLVILEPGVQLPLNWDSAVYYTLQRPGVGMGCFAYRLHLDDKYIHQKSVLWGLRCWIGSWIVNIQTNWSGVPIAGQPHFIYSHYLKCINGYPRTCRAFHAIDLALMSHRYLGDVIQTRYGPASAGVPADYALRHGVYRTILYTVLLGTAHYLGVTEIQLKWALEKFPTLSSLKFNGK
ncbi:hypothetical protein KSF78_0002103 [Schistosoma japonicum]|nr:hypothetical protein KSF78_0002103 [Schistosoma japonicum]